MKKNKPYPYYGKKFYIITYKGKKVKKFGTFRSKYLAEQTIVKSTPIYERQNYEVKPK